MKIFLFNLLFAVAAFGQGTILWDESFNGPFLNSSGSPTSLSPLQLGTNTIIGTTEVVPVGSSWSLFPGFFTMAVPSGLSVTEIWIGVSKPQLAAWLGDPAFVNQQAIIGSASNGSLVSQWGSGPIGVGIDGIQMESHDFQSSPSATGYRLDIFTQNVPEPGTISLLVVGLGLIGLRFYKTAKHNL